MTGREPDHGRMRLTTEQEPLKTCQGIKPGGAASIKLQLSLHAALCVPDQRRFLSNSSAAARPGTGVHFNNLSLAIIIQLSLSKYKISNHDDFKHHLDKATARRKLS